MLVTWLNIKTFTQRDIIFATGRTLDARSAGFVNMLKAKADSLLNAIKNERYTVHGFKSLIAENGIAMMLL